MSTRRHPQIFITLLAFAGMLPGPCQAAPTVGLLIGLRSKDGLAFDQNPIRLADMATQPDVLLVSKSTPSRNGPDAGAMVCYAAVPASIGADRATGLVYTTSVDQGRSWSNITSVVINGWPTDIEGMRACGPAAVQLDDGRLRVYFTVERPKPAPPPAPSRPLPQQPQVPVRPPPGLNDASAAQPAHPAATPVTQTSRVYSAISNDGRTFAFEDGVRFELSGLTDPEVIKLPEAKDGDARRLGPWLMFFTREGSTLLATSRDGLTWTRDETFVWTSARSATAALASPDSRDARLYGCDRTGVVSVRYDPSTGDVHPDPGERVPGGSFHPSISPCGDGAHLLVCLRESTDKPAEPLRNPPPPIQPPRPDRPVFPGRPQ